MPTLEWIGKDKVVNHHQEVPFRVLEDRYTYGAESENLIVHGDNLEVLKALLPRYEGRVKCVYIDPPYNTGNEGWVYNDNVNDPKIRKWLGEVVGREGEDLTRHDKWLCMMYPRLKLLQRLLAEDGIIAVSIDDNELFDLGSIMNEIFGAKNRLACAPVRSEPSGGKDKSVLRTGHEYILFYSNGNQENLCKEEKSTGELNLKDAKGKYRKGRELRKWGAGSLREDRENMWFPLVSPEGETVYPIRNDGKEGRWRIGKENPLTRAILENPDEAHWELCPYDDGVVVNGKSKRWVPFEKIRDAKKSFGWNSWLDGYGTNADATAVIKQLFGDKIFETPKPLSLIEWIVSLHNDENSIILDSFAGSGTTAHAVLNMNKADGGNRRFILVEMMDYAESITAERVKRVIDGYGEGKSAVEGTGGGFRFCELGQPLLIDGNLNETVDAEKIREYVWFTETKRPWPKEENGNPYYLGKQGQTAYYFYYERERVTTLDYDFLSTLPRDGDGFFIYADLCVIPPEELSANHITFKKIPRDIAKL
nr:site-specific DNA-methyltransferase [uncultured Oscillibacter sp.]